MSHVLCNPTMTEKKITLTMAILEWSWKQFSLGAGFLVNQHTVFHIVISFPQMNRFALVCCLFFFHSFIFFLKSYFNLSSQTIHLFTSMKIAMMLWSLNFYLSLKCISRGQNERMIYNIHIYASMPQLYCPTELINLHTYLPLRSWWHGMYIIYIFNAETYHYAYSYHHETQIN